MALLTDKEIKEHLLKYGTIKRINRDGWVIYIKGIACNPKMYSNLQISLSRRIADTNSYSNLTIEDLESNDWEIVENE